MYGATFNVNTYYGTFSSEPAYNGPDDEYRDPDMVAPFTAVDGDYPPIGSGNLDGLKLSSSSSELDSGYLSSYLGSADFWGNAVSSSSDPNRGAYDGSGI
jgi:hypothetical protein